MPGLLDEAAIAACMVYVDLNPVRAGLASTPEESDFTGVQMRIRNSTSHWLCPVSSKTDPNGVLPMTESEYFDLVDRSGRMVRAYKRGVIDSDLEPILRRIGARPEAWVNTVSRFEDKFGLAAGLLSNLRDFAQRLGRRWIAGVSTARASFV